MAEYTEAEIREKIQALESALDNHEQSVQFADRLVTYKSFDEIRNALEYWKRLLRQKAGAGRRNQSRAYATKGFC